MSLWGRSEEPERISNAIGWFQAYSNRASHIHLNHMWHWEQAIDHKGDWGSTMRAHIPRCWDTVVMRKTMQFRTSALSTEFSSEPKTVIKKIQCPSWRNGSEVKSNDCCQRWPRFNAPHLHRSSQSVPSSGLPGCPASIATCRWNIHKNKI